MSSGSKPFSRRSFLAGSAAAAFAAASNHAFAQEAEALGFRLGVCDWSVGKLGDVDALNIARKLRLDGVQVSLGTAGNDMHLRQPAVQERFRNASAQTGVAIASLAIGELNSVPYKSDPRTEQWVADSIDVAQAMGVKVVLLAFFHRGDLRDDPAGVDEVVRRLRRVAPAAERAGVVLGIESWLSAEDHVRIMDRVGSAAVKVYYDLGNSHLRGYDIYKEIRWLGEERICEFHAKDYEFIFGKGKVDFPAARAAMDDIGYRGWIQIEGAHPLGMIESYRQNAAYLRQVFPPRV